MADFVDILENAKKMLGITFQLKDKQLEILKHLYSGRDCISVLPTGYGKSLIFQLLPWICERDSTTTKGKTVIVVSPLNSLIQDQVMSLSERGISACYLDMTGTHGKTYSMLSKSASDACDEEENVELEENVDVHVPKRVSLDSIKNGEFVLIYAHPECLLQNKTIGTILRSKTYQQQVGAIVIDEVHMVSEWGPSFRTSFNRLSELVCVFPDVVHLAMTATATPELIDQLKINLQFNNPAIVKLNPDRPNIYLDIQTKLPNIYKFEKLDQLIKPLAEELKEQRLIFPLTIVYINNLEVIGYAYKYVEAILCGHEYEPVDNRIPENRLFGQYHAESTENIKQAIINELRKSNSKIRLIFASVALGMGLDAPNVSRIIHFQPPTSLENYYQEIGRAGRNGEPSVAVMYFNASDISASRKGLKPTMSAFCKNKASCLRLQLVSHFGFDQVLFCGLPQDCCCNCKGGYV